MSVQDVLKETSPGSIGFVFDQENRACIKQTIDTGYIIPNFLQGNRCVLNCDAGFFPDQTTRVCRPCSSNCYACSNGNLCTNCDEGFGLSSASACVATDACAVGLVDLIPTVWRSVPGYCYNLHSLLP